MNWQETTQINPLSHAGQVIVLEAEAGLARREVLQQWLEMSQSQGAKTWLLNCNFDEDGIWAGLKDFLQDLLPQIQAKAPQLIEKHSYELTLVLPALRRNLAVRNPNLTDLATDDEKVRNYPIDRAYRILQGLIDLLDAWYQQNESKPWIIACDRFSQTGALVRRFFGELMRRRGQSLQLTLMVTADPSQGEKVITQFAPGVIGAKIRLNLPCDEFVGVSPSQMTHLAEELEQEIGGDPIAAEIYLPRLIYYWRLSDQPERALKWQGRGLGIYNHYGFYEDALVYGEAISQNLERLCTEDEEFRWNVVGNLFGCYAAVGNVHRAKQIIETEALAKLSDPRQLVRAYYVMAMLYGRFLPPSERDFQQADAYLEKSLFLLPNLDLPEPEKHFLIAFTMNGLAFVRHRQGRPDEAITLCRQAIQRLNTHLHPQRHRLHRSVLLYNIAQVYGAMKNYEEAIAQFSATLILDPNYSEYHNERGNMYLKLGRLDEATHDYLKAIELSPPYPEVWANLGLCYRLQGQLTESVCAYSVALDLKPQEISSLLGRAQTLELLGEFTRAIADYTAALRLDPNQPMVLANRAVLHYELGNLTEALQDLDRAIILSPNNPELYENRAIALTALEKVTDSQIC